MHYTAYEPPEVFTEYLRARREADRANERLKALEHVLQDYMEANREKTMVIERDGLQQQVTWVKAHRTVLDEAKLRRALTAKVYDKYTVKKLDRRKLEKAMDEGTVDPKVVLQYATVEDNAPHLRYSEKKVEE